MTNLTKREKILILFTLIFFILVSLFYLLKKLNNISNNRKNRLENFDREIIRLKELGQEYQKWKLIKEGTIQSLNKMDASIESLLISQNLREKVSKIQSIEKVLKGGVNRKEIQITINDITSREFLSFLNSLESSSFSNYKVEFMSYSENKKKIGLYRFDIRIAGYEKVKNVK